jgi:hypothetical protein
MVRLIGVILAEQIEGGETRRERAGYRTEANVGL